MKLTHLYIDHFRNLEDVVHPVDGVRVFIGPNGAGKTSLLEAVRRLSDSYTPGNKPFEFFGGYRIYEVDDCLTGDLLVDDEWGDSEQRLLRSDAVFNLAAALLGASATRSVLWEQDGDVGNPEIRDLVVGAEGLNQRLQEGAAIFKCDSELTLLEYLKTHDYPSLDGLRASYAQFGQQLRNDEHVRDATAEMSALCLLEFETIDSLGPIEDRDDYVGLHYQVASQILDLAKVSQRFAWAETQLRESQWLSELVGPGRRDQRWDRAWTYNGVIVDRCDVGDELARQLDNLSERVGAKDWPRSGRSMWGVTQDSAAVMQYELGNVPTPASPYARQVTSPALDAVLSQWVSGERFLRVSFEPFGRRPLWHKGHYTLLGTADHARAIQKYHDSQEKFADLLYGDDAVDPKEIGSHPGLFPINPFDPDMGFGGNPIRLPGFDTAVAEGDAENLHAEVEAGFADLHNHIWAAEERFLTTSGLDPSDLPEVLGTPGRGGSFDLRLGQNDDWLVPADQPFGVRRDGLIDSHEDHIEDPGTAYVVKPSIPPVLALLAYTANQLAPKFLRFADLITVDLKRLSAWSDQNRLHIGFGGRTLDQLPSGWSRWVAISVRMAYRQLGQSQIGLSPTDEEDGNNSHTGDSRTLRAARVMSDPQNAGRAFIVVPPSSDKTTLLIDEPEAHLHPDAALDIKTWLTDTFTETGTSAIVATHSSVFMDYTPDEATITGVEPPGTRADDDSDSTSSKLYNASEDFVTWIEEHGEGLGISSLGGLMFYRGFLIVEGAHDEKILKHFYADELAKHRIGTVNAWGPNDKKGIVESQFLLYAHKPVALLFDNIPTKPSTARGLTKEERSLAEFKEKFALTPIPFQGFGHPRTDIALTLPEDAVQRFLETQLQNPNFPGWQVIDDELRSLPGRPIGVDKKKHVQERLGLVVTEYGYTWPKFIKPILEQCTENSRPCVELEDVMCEIFEWFQDPQRTPGN